MKTLQKNKWMITAVMVLAGVVCAYGYPPDNAAVLYSKAMMLYQPDDAMEKMLVDCAKGDIQPNDKIREFVTNSSAIKPMLDACMIKTCDWGMDYSEGFEMLLPHLGKMRKLSWLVAADARLLAKDGNYREALSRCLCMYKMARHVNDKILISYLVGNAIQKQANDCVVWILGQMPQDDKMLSELKDQLAAIDAVALSVKPGMDGERDGITLAMANKSADDLLRALDVCGVKDESFKKKIRTFDPAMIERNRQYTWDCADRVRMAFDMPYPQAYAEITRLIQQVKEDYKTKPQATFLAALVSTFDAGDAVVPHQNKVLSTATYLDTQDNAIRTAIEIYLIKAKTGSLPTALPDEMPGDLFSGKPFVYEKAKGGFILRCRGKDLSKNEVYNFEFKDR